MSVRKGLCLLLKWITMLFTLCSSISFIQYPPTLEVHFVYSLLYSLSYFPIRFHPVIRFLILFSLFFSRTSRSPVNLHPSSILLHSIPSYSLALIQQFPLTLGMTARFRFNPSSIHRVFEETVEISHSHFSHTDWGWPSITFQKKLSSNRDSRPKWRQNSAICLQWAVHEWNPSAFPERVRAVFLPRTFIPLNFYL